MNTPSTEKLTVIEDPAPALTDAELIAQGKELAMTNDLRPTVADIKAGYLVKYKKPLDLTDDQIILAHMKSDDDQDDWVAYIETWRKNLTKPKAETEETFKVLSHSAHHVAELIDLNETVTHDAETFVQAHDDIRMRAAHALKALTDKWAGAAQGDNTALDPDSLPRPDSIRVEGTLQPYALYTRTASDGTEINGDWFEDMAAQTKRGKAILADIKSHKDALASKEDQNISADPNLRSMSVVQLDGLVKKFDRQFDNLANFYRNVAGLWYVMMDIKDTFPNVFVDFQMAGNDFRAGPDGTLEPVPNRERALIATTYPFYMQDKLQPTKTKKLSISDLLRYKVAAAVKALPAHNGNQYDALQATQRAKKKTKGRKGKGETGAGTAESKLPPLTIAELPDWFIRGAIFMDMKDPDGRRRIQAATEQAKTWSDDAVNTFYLIRHAMDAIEVGAGLLKRYNKLTDVNKDDVEPKIAAK